MERNKDKLNKQLFKLKKKKKGETFFFNSEMRINRAVIIYECTQRKRINRISNVNDTSKKK